VTALALVVYALALAVAATFVWRRPVVALYVFVVGLALHNAVMDALYGAGIHGHALTVIQAWKDVLLLIALARVAVDALRARRLPFRPALPDAFALAFAVLVVVYALIPQSVLDAAATHKAIALALRHDLTGVAAYFLGRSVLLPELDRRRVAWTILGVAAAVSAWGLIDVYAISLNWWRHNGTVGYFHHLGFHYKGLSGLPENFVYNTGNEQDLLRRLVSTFLSPLGTAYLCVVALLLAPRVRLALPVAALVAAGLLWTHTRAAIIALAAALVLFAAGTRRAWPIAAAVATLAVGFAFVKAFPHIGPKTHFTRSELAYQRAHAHKHKGASGSATSTNEPSTESHLSSLGEGFRTVVHHPQGYGLGNAGEVASREGIPLKAGESNYTELGVETGLLGALLFVAWNLSLVWKLVPRRPAAAAALGAILIVALQTDAYGIPWLAYCLWWLAGSGVSGLAAGASRARQSSPQ